MDTALPALPAAVACPTSPAGHRWQLRDWGRAPWPRTAEAMQAFTAARTPDTPDELWLVEHEPVFTQGTAGRAEHVLAAGDIPVVASNRGGQVTYHGPGQVVAYPLVDLRRRGYFVKEFVHRIEEAVLRTLAELGVTAHRVVGAPGLYVRLADPFGHARLQPVAPGEDPFRGLGKIAALGLKISRQGSYHGVALNVALDLEPFGRIDPCGYVGLKTVDLASLDVTADPAAVARSLATHLIRQLD